MVARHTGSGELYFVVDSTFKNVSTIEVIEPFRSTLYLVNSSIGSTINRAVNILPQLSTIVGASSRSNGRVGKQVGA